MVLKWQHVIVSLDKNIIQFVVPGTIFMLDIFELYSQLPVFEGGAWAKGSIVKDLKVKINLAGME